MNAPKYNKFNFANKRLDSKYRIIKSITALLKNQNVSNQGLANPSSCKEDFILKQDLIPALSEKHFYQLNEHKGSHVFRFAVTKIFQKVFFSEFHSQIMAKDPSSRGV